MDLDEQERIKQVVDANGGPDGIVVILGSPDADSAAFSPRQSQWAIQVRRSPGRSFVETPRITTSQNPKFEPR